jgi:hypothetical protein
LIDLGEVAEHMAIDTSLSAFSSFPATAPNILQGMEVL